MKLQMPFDFWVKIGASGQNKWNAIREQEIAQKIRPNVRIMSEGYDFRVSRQAHSILVKLPLTMGFSCRTDPTY